MSSADASDGRSVYDRMKDDILSLALRPGQDLDEVSLSKRYGVSRTPIREALIRLASDRLVDVGRNRRASVTALIIADFPRFIEALDLTRRAVSRLAARRRHAADLEKLHAAEKAFAAAARHAGPGNDAVARTIAPAEYAFHMRVAEAGHNGYLTQSYEQLLTFGHRMLRIPYAYEPQPGEPLALYSRAITAHHRALVAAIEAGNDDRAEEEARRITERLVMRLRSYLEENLTARVALDPAVADHAAPAKMRRRA